MQKMRCALALLSSVLCVQGGLAYDPLTSCKHEQSLKASEQGAIVDESPFIVDRASAPFTDSYAIIVHCSDSGDRYVLARRVSGGPRHLRPNGPWYEYHSLNELVAQMGYLTKKTGCGFFPGSPTSYRIKSGRLRALTEVEAQRIRGLIRALK